MFYLSSEKELKGLTKPTNFCSGIPHTKAMPWHTELRNLTLKNNTFHELLSMYATLESICVSVAWKHPLHLEKTAPCRVRSLCACAALCQVTVS